MTNVSMDHSTAEKFNLTSFGRGGSHIIYRAPATVRPRTTPNPWPGCMTAAQRRDGRVG
jgi:hypothetical protein